MVKGFLYSVIAMLHLSASLAIAEKNNYYSKLMNSWNDPSFDISKAVTKADWAFFMQSSTQWKQGLWEYHLRQGKALGDWSWTWRSGWLQVCGKQRLQWCSKILQDALFDKAVVIRAKAAQIWGRLYSGTGNIMVGGLLEKAYQLKENNRNGKPLFVKNRILFALRTIGGDENLLKGRELAKSDGQMLAYWEKL